jgi:acyl carrier protein
VTRDTQPPCDTVTIDRDSQGEPTGIFFDNNRMPVVEFTLMRKVPAFDLATRIKALPRSMKIYNSFGTTSVYEGHGAAADVIEAYKSVNAAGEATVRATLALSPAWPDGNQADVAELIADWARWLSHKGLGDDWLRLNGLYTDVEDTPEHRLRKSVYPETGWAGFNFAGLPQQAVKELLIACARNDIRVNAIAGSMLDTFDEVAKIAPIAGQRWVLAHITALDDRRISLLREHGIVVTTHTNGYIWKSGAQFRDSLGPGRENDVVPLRRLLDAGVAVALGTDNVPVSLWYPIWQTVARIDRKTQETVAPEQALKVLERLLRQGSAQVAAVPVNWQQYRQFYPAGSESPLLSQLAREEADLPLPADHPGEKKEITCAAVLAAEPGERHQLLQSYLSEQVARVLGLSASKLDVQQPLSNLGLDSLMAVELKNRIAVDLGVNVPMVKFLEGPSVSQAATQVLDQLTAEASTPSVPLALAVTPRQGEQKNGSINEHLLANLDQLSDEEVDSLLTEMLAEEKGSE